MNKRLLGKLKAFNFTMACLLMVFSSSLWSAPLKVALIDTPESITKAYMLKHILEVKTDHKVNLVSTTVDDMWQGVVKGELDASVSVNLPEQQAKFDQYRNQVDDLGPNWIGKNLTIHTVIRKGLTEQDVPIVRFINNYCLCGERLNSAKSLLKNNKISREDAIVWMDEHQAWLHNMMGFARPYEDRENRNVTY
jgi:ABC-type proline/glycine betaine transport system substrate-binding protein